MTPAGPHPWLVGLLVVTLVLAALLLARHLRLRREQSRLARTQADLRASSASYRALFNSVTELIYIQDVDDGRFLDVNEAVIRAYGYTRDELIGSTPALLADPDRVDLEEVRRLFEKAAAGEPQRFEWWARRKDGSTFPKEAVLVQGTYFGQPVVIAVARDISERREAEDALRRGAEQLQQSQKMDAVGLLAGGVAHDFNNLLTSIQGHTELLLDRATDDDPARMDLEEIQRAAERASRLTRKLLAFSRRQVLQPRVLDLARELQEMEEMLRHVLGEDIRLTIDPIPDLGRVRVDPAELEQLMVNLVLNARDALPGGGTVRIELRNCTAPGCRSIQERVPDGPYVVVRVRDDGVGMDDETRARVFEPFFTTKSGDQVRGLGLSTVYGIVRQSGGDAWVESEPGRGTTVSLCFPRLTAEAKPTPTVASRRGHGTATVLLVEDEPGVRNLVRRILEQHGHQVVEAGDGQEAWELARSMDRPIDLLLTDVIMPRMHGTELADRLRDSDPGLPVLFVSGYTDNERLRSGALAPGQAFLEKPFTPGDLHDAVQTLLAEVPDDGPTG